MNATAPIIYQCASGWWWPASDENARPVILRDCAPASAALLPHLNADRRVIVQAGGNVGVYPVALTDHFSMVVTCEPDPVNYQCLVKNLEARDSLHRVVAYHAALGEEPGMCASREVHARNCGAHRVEFHTGTTPVTTIDTFNLGQCDAIWLDVEGSELFALRGAIQTIKRHSPVIACEDKGLDRQFFGVEPGALQKFLGDLGYEEVDRMGNDKIFRRRA